MIEILLLIIISIFWAMNRIPQSTSIITVGSFVGAGLYFKSLNFSLIGRLIIVWVGVSILSYFLLILLRARFIRRGRRI